MPYVTTWERNGMRKMLEDAMRTKFGEEAVELMRPISERNDAETYLALNRRLIKAKTLDDIRRACAKVMAPPRPRKKRGHGKGGSAKPFAPPSE
jgi:hypothetical protein